MRLSTEALLILVSLADGPKHGYAIQQDIHVVAGRRLARCRGLGSPGKSFRLYRAALRGLRPLSPYSWRNPCEQSKKEGQKRR